MTGMDLEDVARAHATQTQQGSLKYLLISSALASAAQFGVIARVLSAGDAYLGLLFMLSFLTGSLLIGFFQGHMADVCRRKRSLVIVTFLGTVLCHLMLQVGWEDILLLLGILMGALVGLFRTFSIALIIDVVPSENRGRCVPLYYSALLAGWLLSIVMFYLGVGRDLLVYVSFLGLLALVPANVRFRAPVQSPVVSLDRFFLLKGSPAFLATLPLFASVPMMWGFGWFNGWWVLLLPVLLFLVLMMSFMMMLHITEHCRRSTTANSCLVGMDFGIASGLCLSMHPVVNSHQMAAVAISVALFLVVALPLRSYIRHHKRR